MSLKAALKKGLEAKIFKSFSKIIPYTIVDLNNDKIDKLDFNYIAGLAAFSTYKPFIITNCANFDAAFRLAQDKRDKSFM